MPRVDSCQIDRTPGADSYPPHVGPPLVDLDLEAAFHQFHRQQRPSQPGTDQRDRLGIARHRENMLRAVQDTPGVSSVRASQSSGKNFLSSVSFR